ncbi:spinocerebellar ataxia type 10 protein domain-containing protein [Halteromyces radiatus]|uniref:spinocerebellar ataxia type 10 protein domain-containing protein n=1 Tax=Halteromyces radiatus TaxID=101107 RepID=UPI00221F085A|nr:spinocerebellar ataxia type 10 protein domain-containing protein [Halteromyces radiatus]KAI8077873.1 spinocerebellar ataxia type 10 protein domain-containing protein [Halteromyces radiatus]
MDQIIKLLDQFIQHNILTDELEKNLKTTLQRTLADTSFRLNLGRDLTFWQNIYTILIDLENKNTLLLSITCLIELIKLARNVTAENREGQLLALNTKVIYALTPLILHYLPHMDESSMMVVRVCTQAACNMVTGNEMVLNIVWTHWCKEQHPFLWNKVIEANDKDTVTSGLVLISQCIRNNKHRCEMLVKSDGGLAYLQAVLMEIDRSHTEESNQHFELGYIIVSELFKYGYFVDIMDALKEDSNNRDEINQNQMVIIKLLDSTLYKHPDISVPLTMIDYGKLGDVLCLLSKQACTVIEHAVVSHRDILSNLDLHTVSLMYTCLVLLLQIVNLLLETTINDMKSSLMDRNGLIIIIDLLRQCETMVDWNDKEKSRIGFNFVKREIVRCIGLLCYKDKIVQDKVRTSGGLPLILNQMKIDDNNPYIREYATVTLRHLLEDNFENQQMIAELTPIQAVQNEILDEMGIHASIIDGKLQLEPTTKK